MQNLPEIYVVVDNYGGVPIIKPYLDRDSADAILETLMGFTHLPTDPPKMVVYRPAVGDERDAR